MRCFVVAAFLLTSASRCPSAIAELLVIQYRSVTDTHTHTHTHTTTAYTALSIASRGKNTLGILSSFRVEWIKLIGVYKQHSNNNGRVSASERRGLPPAAGSEWLGMPN